MFGLGLYMAPSDMDLRIGQISGYNNLIMIASEKQTLGINPEANADAVPVLADTGEQGLVTPPEQLLGQEVAQPSEAPTPAEKDASQLHADERTALVVGGVALGLIALLISSKIYH